ncbi:MAG: peptidylprolyl isomerase [Deltaproteobacteria bacterium]|nr:peptidylprolyl isomerase [Deltaproteobacteria bacterium]
MRLNRSAYLFVFFVAGLTIILPGFGPLCLAGSNDPVVATVNDIPIIKSQVDLLVPRYQREAGKKKLDNEDKKRLLQNLIRRQLILQQKSVQDFKRDEKIIKKVEEYENKLIISHFLKEQVGSKLIVSNEELEKYYQENIREFSSPPKVKARHILLRTREEADRVLSRLRKGEDFGQLAKDFSIDLPDALGGGSMGIIEKGIVLPELEKELFSLNEGGISDIVKTRFGYHILTVDKIILLKFKPFEEVRDQIKQTILRQKEANAFDEMAAKLEKDADIKIFEYRLHKASD